MRLSNNMDMNIGQRVKAARKKLGLSVAETAKRSGMAASTLYDLERGDQESTIKLPALARTLCVSVDWLETGRGRMHTPGGDNPGADLEQITTGRRIPLISWSQIDSEGTLKNPEYVAAPPIDCGHETFALRVRGISMFNPSEHKSSFADGDVIYVDPARPAHSGCVAVVRLPGTADYILRQVVMEGANTYLRATNPAWPEGIARLCADSQVVGVVIGKFIPT